MAIVILNRYKKITAQFITLKSHHFAAKNRKLDLIFLK